MIVKRLLKQLILPLVYGGEGRFCSVCSKSSRKFRGFSCSELHRSDAQCYHCGSVERHRFLKLYLNRNPELLKGDGRSMLHVAPESFFIPMFKEAFGEGYLTADYLDPRAMVKMDITDIQYPDESFDLIYCSHVLEHVSDDRKAMREFRRVLKKNGTAIIMVPIMGEITFEDPSITDPEQRRQIYGQFDHVRRYGPDFVERLRGAGFNVEEHTISQVANSEQIRLMRLRPVAGSIYVCRRSDF